MPAPTYLFYGIQLSLYAGKVRAYLRKKGLRFLERETSHPGFAVASEGLPFPKQPLIETPEGEVVQDTTEIIDFLEARHPERSVYPDGPVQRLVGLILELYGDEGLMKPAMHYRWAFPDRNDTFLREEFGRSFRTSPSEHAAGLAAADGLLGFMRSQVVPALGVTPESGPAIEAAYEELLDALEAHFRLHPYLLGGRPSIGDFGVIAPLYGHLGRDPVPLELMKSRAPACHRWVERMNVADAGLAEFPDTVEDYLPDDEVPASLFPILRLMAEDYLPELLGIVSSVNDWLGAQPPLPPGTRFPASTQTMGTRSPIGTHRVKLRGVEIEIAVQHYTIWMLQRVLDHYADLEPVARGRANAILEETGLMPLVQASPMRRIERENFIEVLR